MAPTVQLLPPNAPQWIQLQWNHWYTVLNRPETDPAMQQRIIQQLNTLVAQARQLQQAAQQTAQQSTVLSQIAAQLRTMLQSVQPYLRQALAFAGAPVAVAMRYVSLASAFLVSDGAAVMLMGFALAAAKVMLAVLAVIALLMVRQRQTT